MSSNKQQQLLANLEKQRVKSGRESGVIKWTGKVLPEIQAAAQKVVDRSRPKEDPYMALYDKADQLNRQQMQSKIDTVKSQRSVGQELELG